MGKTSSEVINRSKKKIYDEIKALVRKDSNYNKEFILKHIEFYGYNSISDFIVQSINNQIESDIHNK